MPTKQKYTLVRKLDSGGMAEVFLGEAESLEGFKKRVAIKRILPHLGGDKKFIRMFLDEARLCLRLNHGNVVQVFDVGRSTAGSYFIVMEYVGGTNLKLVLEHFRRHKRPMPIEIAIYIAMEICGGLSYAHTLKDRAGNHLGIVHRDISPPNILLSTQGEIKIVDFGLAKATSQLERTEPGIVKGKYAYLSPEAAWGHDVDFRTDIFACGIVLWEMITGKRLFSSPNTVDVVKNIREARVPSMAEYREEVDSRLEIIVRKALAREPADRYQSCEEFTEALADYLFILGRRVTAFDLQRVVEEAMTDEEETSTKRTSSIDLLVQEEMSGFASLEEATDDLDSKEELVRNLTAEIEGTVATAGAMPLIPEVFEQGEDELDDPRLLPRDESYGGPGAAQRKATGVRERDEDTESLAQLLEGESGLIDPHAQRAAPRRSLLWVGLALATIVATTVLLWLALTD